MITVHDENDVTTINEYDEDGDITVSLPLSADECYRVGHGLMQAAFRRLAQGDIVLAMDDEEASEDAALSMDYMRILSDGIVHCLVADVPLDAYIEALKRFGLVSITEQKAAPAEVVDFPRPVT